MRKWWVIFIKSGWSWWKLDYPKSSKWTVIKDLDEYLKDRLNLGLWIVLLQRSGPFTFANRSFSRIVHFKSLGLMSGLIHNRPCSVIKTVQFDFHGPFTLSHGRPLCTLLVQKALSRSSYFDQKFKIVPGKWLVWEKMTNATFSNFCRSRSHFRNHSPF